MQERIRPESKYNEDWIEGIVRQLKQCPIGSDVADKAKRMIQAAESQPAAEAHPTWVYYPDTSDGNPPMQYPKIIC